MTNTPFVSKKPKPPTVPQRVAKIIASHVNEIQYEAIMEDLEALHVELLASERQPSRSKKRRAG